MKKTHIWLLLILLLTLFLRTFRAADFLGFWFDQGRDALEIWNFTHGRRPPFLVGPTTGIEGIFLGPFYYYLITPPYLLGQGNPIYPAVWLALITTFAVFLLYKIGTDFFSPRVGLLAAFLYGFSHQFVNYNRWLSNPTALPLFSLLCIWILLHLIHQSKSLYLWPILGLALGLGLQLEAASAIFFLPATLLIIYVYRRHIHFSHKTLFLSSAFFGLTLVPQLAFDFRHDHLLLNSFQKFLLAEKSFRPQLSDLLRQRLLFYFEIFTNKFYFTYWAKILFVVSTPLLLLLTIIKRRLPLRPTLALFIWWLIPTLFLLFYHGNRGYVWDYYFTGAYPALVLLVAAIWHSLSRWHLGRLTVSCFLAIFIFHNLRAHLAFFSQPLPGYISLTPIVDAVDWIYRDATVSSQPFNVDVYVPPVIPYAYDYVFLWRGTTLFFTQPQTELTPRLYTLLEPDHEHPHLRAAWLVRQSTIGSIEVEQQVGPITIHRRHRFSLLP